MKMRQRKLIEKIKVISNIDIMFNLIPIFPMLEIKKRQKSKIARYERIVSIFDKNEVKYGVKHIQASPLLF